MALFEVLGFQGKTSALRSSWCLVFENWLKMCFETAAILDCVVLTVLPSEQM